jgi:predicted metalloprotease
MNKQIKLLGIIAFVVIIAFSACQKDGGDFTYEGTTTITITGYTGLKGVDIIIPAKINGKSVISIGDSAFKNSELTGVTIPDSVTSISDFAFYNNQLTTVTIPDSVTSIGSMAFFPVLTAINVSTKNPNYSSVDGVLYNKNGSTLIQWPVRKTSYVIPDSVTSIGDFSFANNELTSVTIPGSVTSIGAHAFSGNQLTSVTIPDSVTSIGRMGLCPVLTAINVSAKNPNYSSVDGVLYNKNGSTLIQWPAGKISDVIPDSVTFIGDYAFRDNKLTSVTIPDSVTSIGAYAFSNNELTSVTIPASVTSIGFGAFSENELISVTIPDSITSIGGFAFDKNELTSVTISDNVTYIGSYAFYDNKLTSVTIGADVTIGSASFSYRDGNNTFSSGFEEAYNITYNKTAGTYTRSNIDSIAWTKQ